MPIEKEQIAELIQDNDFRSQFTADFVHEFLSAQIRALRDKMGWRQEELGHKAGGMEQAQVSRLEDPDYSGGTLKSLIRLAQAFDVGLLVRFVPFSKLVDSTVDLTPDNIAPPSFKEDQFQFVTEKVNTMATTYAHDLNTDFKLNFDPDYKAKINGEGQNVTA